MLIATQIGGFIDAGLAGAAYIPQISHLIRARCSAGISRLAFGVWLLSSLLITAHAIAIHAGAFIVLGAIQIGATARIMVYAARYQDTSCPIHRPRQPTAETATGTGRSLHSHAITGFQDSHAVTGFPDCHAVTEFQAAHLGGTR